MLTNISEGPRGRGDGRAIKTAGTQAGVIYGGEGGGSCVVGVGKCLLQNVHPLGNYTAVEFVSIFICFLLLFSFIPLFIMDSYIRTFSPRYT